MTNYRIKYTSCVSKIARDTDLEIKIANNTPTSLREPTREWKSCFDTKSLFNQCNENKIFFLKNFIQISFSLCLKEKRVPLAHREAV